MKENTVVAFQNPSDFQKDPLTEVLQAGARELLAQAVEAEVSVFLGSHAALVDAAGRRRVVRNGYLPERFIQTGIGPVSVRQPRVRDRGDGAIRFTSAILPRYLRRAKSLEDLLPWLYLKGISTGDFGEALAALLGSSAPGLSASTITRLKEVWGVEAERWQRRDLTAKRYVYFWVDGIYLPLFSCSQHRWRRRTWKLGGTHICAATTWRLYVNFGRWPSAATSWPRSVSVTCTTRAWALRKTITEAAKWYRMHSPTRSPALPGHS